MALQAESLAGSYSPQVVAAAFVKQYYEILRYTRQDAYKFYNDSSILGRPDSDGNMISVTTIDDIKTQLLSTDLSHCLIELESVDSQPSHVDGVLILVAGSFTIDAVKQKFTQSFFLAPQGNGYFVLNDMFKFARPSTELKEVVANRDNESTQSTTSPAEPEAASIKESTVPNIPAAENVVPVNDEVSPSTKVISEVRNDAVVEKCVEAVPTSKAVSQVKNAVAVEACVKVDNKDIERLPEAAPASPSAEKEIPKTTYASIVKTMRESIPPAPAAKPIPNPKSKVAQNVEKPSLPTKPAHAATTAPPSDNNVSKNKSSDEPGYSVFVKNLPFEATVEMVAEEFSKFGAIKHGGIQVKKYQTDRFCFGFVEFESKHSMEAAIEAYTVYFGSCESYIEEKRTKTRVVDGVITHGDDNGNGGGRFQSGRGGYHRDSYRGYRNNGYYHDGNNMRNDFRNQSEYSGRGRGPQGNGYHNNRNGYHQNGNGYPQDGNGGHQQRRPNSNGNGNGNGKAERSSGPKNGNGNGNAEHSNGPKQQTAPVASYNCHFVVHGSSEECLFESSRE